MLENIQICMNYSKPGVTVGLIGNFGVGPSQPIDMKTMGLGVGPSLLIDIDSNSIQKGALLRLRLVFLVAKTRGEGERVSLELMPC